MIPWGKPWLSGKEKEYVISALEANWISGGDFVDKLELFFTNEMDKCAVSTTNGTTALHMAFLALGVEPGDEIVVPGFCFLAAANVAMNMGAKVIFADVSADTWCLNGESIRKVLSPRTKVVVPVHTYGNVCNMTEIMDLSKEHGFYVVEDAAEALFSKWDGRYAGTYGHIGTYSFQATKTITTGEGGMVVTDNRELYEKMKLIRNHGMNERRYYHEVAGLNFRLTNLQAAVGVAQLENYEEGIRIRKNIDKYYRKECSPYSVKLQKIEPATDFVMWAFALRLLNVDRDTVIRKMSEMGIETRPGFYSPNRMLHLYKKSNIPVSEQLSENVISLPSYPSLSQEELHKITNSLRNILSYMVL